MMDSRNKWLHRLVMETFRETKGGALTDEKALEMARIAVAREYRDAFMKYARCVPTLRIITEVIDHLEEELIFLIDTEIELETYAKISHWYDGCIKDIANIIHVDIPNYR